MRNNPPIEWTAYAKTFEGPADVHADGGTVSGVSMRAGFPWDRSSDPVLELYPNAEQYPALANAHEFAVRCVLGSPSEGQRTIISFPRAYTRVIEGVCGPHPVIRLEPWKAWFAYERGEANPKVSPSFWVTKNTFVEPALRIKNSFTGKREVKRNHVVKFNVDGVDYCFDRHFVSRSMENHREEVSSSLVLTSSQEAEADGIEREILPTIDDLLLLLSVATREPTACFGWGFGGERSYGFHFRNDRTYPSGGTRERHRDPTVVPDDDTLPTFLAHALARLPQHPWAETLRGSMNLALDRQGETLESRFLSRFVGVEQVLDAHRRGYKILGPIPEDQWTRASTSLRDSLRSLDVSPTAASLLGKRIEQLNRPSTREVFEHYCAEYKLETPHLWPMFGTGKSLHRIRSQIVHGHRFDPESAYALWVASEHLLRWLERMILVALEWTPGTSVSFYKGVGDSYLPGTGEEDRAMILQQLK